MSTYLSSLVRSYKYYIKLHCKTLMEQSNNTSKETSWSIRCNVKQPEPILWWGKEVRTQSAPSQLSCMTVKLLKTLIRTHGALHLPPHFVPKLDTWIMTWKILMFLDFPWQDSTFALTSLETRVPTCFTWDSNRRVLRLKAPFFWEAFTQVSFW